MTTWTKELPKVDGYYWYRTTPQTEAQVVELDLTMPWVMFTGSDVPHGPSFLHKIDGEFWPERILSPTERFSLKVKPEMWRHLSSLFTPGNTTHYVPGQPTSVQVKIDPNQPHA